MAIDANSKTPYTAKEIYDLDKRFESMFIFRKVFTELNMISNSDVRWEIKIHIMTLLEHLVNQFEDEDKRANANSERHFAWAFLPIASGWRRLHNEDFHHSDEGDYTLVNPSSNPLGSMMYDYGQMNFGLLDIISHGPYGMKYRNNYHRHLTKMVEHMGSQIYHKVNTSTEMKIFWNTANAGLGDKHREEPLIHILEALFRGVK